MHSKNKGNVFITLLSKNKKNDLVALHSKDKGNVLIIVMIFGAIMAMLSLALMESAGLQYRMIAHMEASQINKKQLIKKLTVFEEKWENKSPVVIDPTLKIAPIKNDDFDAIPLQFVPDTLHFQESQGVQYYRITSKVKLNNKNEFPFKVKSANQNKLSFKVKSDNQNDPPLQISSTYAMRVMRRSTSNQ